MDTAQPNYSAMLASCQQGWNVASEHKARRHEEAERRLQERMKMVMDGIKSNRFIYGSLVRVEFHLAHEWECKQLADRLNQRFPGANWEHMILHDSCAVYYGSLCDCRSSQYGVRCDLRNLTVSLEKISRQGGDE